MTKEEMIDAVSKLLGSTPERAILADCVYKGEAFRSLSITVSDSKDDGFEIPYATFSDSERNEDFMSLLKTRKSPEMEEKVSALLLEIREALDALGLDFTEEDMKSLIRLEKPVIMVSRRR